MQRFHHRPSRGLRRRSRKARSGGAGRPRRSTPLRLLILLLLLFGGQILALQQQDEPESEAVAEQGSSEGSTAAEAGATQERVGDVFVARVESIIQPVVADFLVEGLAEADEAGAELFVLELNTPGGLLTSTQRIYSAMLEAETPVAVFVAPRGAEAASAGFFLLMAADVAAMAPGTNTGAAHPVGGQGEDIEGTMGEKVEQNAAAKIRSLAARNGRDEALAEAAVVESRSYSAEEALELGLADLLAEDTSDLLAQLDGREVEKVEGEKRVLALGAAPRVRELEMSGIQRLRSILVHPNVAYILMSLGWLGLVVEVYNPGSIFPGVIGVICLILAFYGLSVLPVNYAGVALIGLAILLFIAELKVPSFGFLTVAGVTCLVLGSLLLFKTADPAVRVSMQLIVAFTVASLVIVLGLGSLAVRAHRSRVATGQEGLITQQGLARSAIDPRGKVLIHGEIWNAVADAPIESGETVEVVAVDGLTLKVRPLREVQT